MMPGNVNVSLIVSNPQLTLRRGDIVSSGWQLGYRVQLANSYRQHVELTTEEGDLKNLDGFVYFPENDEIEPYYGFEKGVLVYSKGFNDPISGVAPSFGIWLRLPPEDRARLTQASATGLPLMSVNIDVAGMEYGWAPDGSEKKWDNKAKRELEVKGYNLFFGQHEEEELVPDPPEPAVDTGVKALTAVREVQKALNYILMLLAVIVVLLFIRR